MDKRLFPVRVIATIDTLHYAEKHPIMYLVNGILVSEETYNAICEQESGLRDFHFVTNTQEQAARSES